MPLANRAAGDRAIIVDIDDTLVDTKGAFVRALSDIAATYLPHLPPERYGEVVALWRRDPHGYYRAFTRGELGFREQRLARAEELQAQFGGAPLEDDGFDNWNAAFESSFEANWRAFDDAEPFLGAALADGYRIGSVSNADTVYQEHKLARVGLGGFVQTIVGVDVLGFGKPSPRVFELACGRLGITPDRATYVGDELDIDARAAQAAGLRGVWIDRPGTRRGGPFDEDKSAALADGLIVVESLADVLSALA